MNSNPGSDSTSSLRFCVGEVVVDASSNEIDVHGNLQRLESRTMAVLVYLAQHGGGVARREALLADVWRGRIVTDDSLTRAIAQLRQALGDASAIETLPKIGYRLKWPVRALVEATDVVQIMVDAPVPTASTEAVAPDVVPPRSRLGWLSLMALLAVLVAYAWTRPLSEPAAPALEPMVIASVTPVTAIPGVKRMPRFSRDGQSLVFDLQQGSLVDRDLWVVDMPSGAAKQITHGPANEQHADWTRDGSALIYVRSEGGHCELVRRTLATGVEHVIRSCRYGSFVRPRVSPDGEYIVYSDLVENGTQAVVFEAELRTGKQRQLTHPDPSWFDLYPDYTPDGSQILFGRATLSAVRDLYLLDRVSGETRRLHHEPGIITDATMESAESYLFATQRTGQMQLIRRDLLGGEQALGLGADYIRGAVLNGARTQLAFESWTVRQRMVRSPLDAEASVDISASSRIDRVPMLSPDGLRIAFVSTRDGYANVWLNENGIERQLTQFRPEDPEFLRWHPTQPWLAFSITRGDGSFACMLDVAVSTPDLRCIAHAGSAAPFWAVDGRAFRYTAPDGQGYAVFEIDQFDATAQPRKVIDDAYFAQPFGDGGHCFMRSGRDGIWCGKNGAEHLVIAEHGWFNHKSWMLNAANEVVYALQLDGRVLKAGVDDTSATVIGHLPGRLHPNSGLNRDRDGQFIYAVLTTYESELMLATLATH